MTYNRGCCNRRQVESIHPIGGCSMRYDRRTGPVYTENNNCSETVEQNYRLAMVYSPYQEWQNIYNGDKALEVGTIFAELDKPFKGYKCSGGVCSL